MADRRERAEERLNQPRAARRVSTPSIDPEAFGRVSERVARNFGTAKYIVIQTVLVILWIAYNGYVVSGADQLRPLPVHPAQPGLLHPGRVRRPADPARPEPPDRPRPGRPGAGPRGQRAPARRHRVPGPRGGRDPDRARRGRHPGLPALGAAAPARRGPPARRGAAGRRSRRTGRGAPTRPPGADAPAGRASSWDGTRRQAGVSTSSPGSAAPRPPAPRPAAPGRTRRRLGDVLVSQGVLTDAQLEVCLGAAGRGGRRAPRDAGSGRRGRRGSGHRGAAGPGAGRPRWTSRWSTCSRTPLIPEDVRRLPRAVAERCGMLVSPATAACCTVATADPTNVVALDDVRMYTGAQRPARRGGHRVPDPRAAAAVLEPDRGLRRRQHPVRGPRRRAAEDEPLDQASAPGDAPVVRLVDVVLADAVRAGASDIHVEPQAPALRIRYRVDGMLRDVMTVPRCASRALVSRLKIVSGLDIAERRRPQDGRTRVTSTGRPSTPGSARCPACTARRSSSGCCPASQDVPRLAALGLDEAQLETVLACLVNPQGLVLITGPTGSGKTNTLYAALAQLNSAERNIVTPRGPGRGPGRRASPRCRSTSAPGSPSPAGCARCCARTPTW